MRKQINDSEVLAIMWDIKKATGKKWNEITFFIRAGDSNEIIFEKFKTVFGEDIINYKESLKKYEKETPAPLLGT